MNLLDPRQYVHRAKSPMAQQKRSKSMMKMGGKTRQTSFADSFSENALSLSPKEEKMLNSVIGHKAMAEIPTNPKPSHYQDLILLQQENRELQTRCLRSEVNYEQSLIKLSQELKELQEQQTQKSRSEVALQILEEVRTIRHKLDRIERIAQEALKTPNSNF